MSNESKIKSMPYRIAEGEIDLMKIRSSAAIVRAAATRERRRALRWGVSIAMAMSVLLLFVAVSYLTPAGNYDVFIEQLADMPVDVLYDMSVDVVEYESDITLL